MAFTALRRAQEEDNETSGLHGVPEQAVDHEREALWDEIGEAERPVESVPQPADMGEPRSTGSSPASSSVRGSDAEDRAAEDRALWSTFPRSEWNFVARAKGNASLLHPQELYRHRELNPLDKYIPRGMRDELDAIIASTHPLMKRASDLLQTTRREEMQEIIAAGQAESVSRQAHGLDFPRRGLVGGTMLISGNTPNQAHWAPASKLPRTAAVQEIVTFKGVNVGGSIVGWFEARGICPSGQANKLMSKF